MNVSLTPELEKFVSDKVSSGRYTSASEVVREALRLLEEQEQSRILQLGTQNLDLLRHLWQQAIDDKTEGANVDRVLDRLEQKYQALADTAPAVA